MEKQYLICAFGPDRPGIVEELAKTISQHHFNIYDSKMSILGDHFAVLMMIRGEDAYSPLLRERLDGIHYLRITVTELKARERLGDWLEYSITMFGEDQQGIVEKISGYIKSQGGNLITVDTTVSNAPHSGTEFFEMIVKVEVPKTLRLREFKRGLSDLCDSLNLDLDIDPLKR